MNTIKKFIGISIILPIKPNWHIRIKTWLLNKMLCPWIALGWTEK